MSEPVAIITSAPARTMVQLRGALGALAGPVRDLTGADLPEPLRVSHGDKGAVAWMSPDELLLMLPQGQGPDAVTRLEQALAGQHHLALDVSDMRIALQVSGPFAREILAKVVPVDLAPGAFTTGTFRRTKIGQVAGALWLAGGDRFTVIGFRSTGDYLRALLEQSARDGAVGIW